MYHIPNFARNEYRNLVKPKKMKCLVHNRYLEVEKMHVLFSDLVLHINNECTFMGSVITLVLDDVVTFRCLANILMRNGFVFSLRYRIF